MTDRRSWGWRILAVLGLAVLMASYSPLPADAQTSGCESCRLNFTCTVDLCFYYYDCEGPPRFSRCEIWPGGSCFDENFCKWAGTDASPDSEPLAVLSSVELAKAPSCERVVEVRMDRPAP